ncbi:hypothetical protein ACROYT_G015312 [Oculina patagonica]
MSAPKKGTRRPYTAAESQAVLDFAVEHGLDDLLGNEVWKLAERLAITPHSWQSMRDHYITLIIKPAAKRPRIALLSPPSTTHPRPPPHAPHLPRPHPPLHPHPHHIYHCPPRLALPSSSGQAHPHAPHHPPLYPPPLHPLPHAPHQPPPHPPPLYPPPLNDSDGPAVLHNMYVASRNYLISLQIHGYGYG